MPSALCRSSRLECAAVADQQMEGVIPSFTGTLSQLALHENCLQVLPDLHLKDNATRTALLLQNNLLSCSAPKCGNAKVGTSVIAIGNRLGHAKGQYPAWVSKHEQDPLFWVSGFEGLLLFRRISAATAFFILTVSWKLTNDGSPRLMSEWLSGPAAHLWLMQTSFHLVSCLVKESLLAAVFLMLLLAWDLYACPETLAMASACLRSSALIRALVFLCWCQLSFHSLAVEHLTQEGENQARQWTAKQLRKRMLLWLQLYVLTLVLSSASILYQVSNGFFFLEEGKNRDAPLLSEAPQNERYASL